MISSIEITRFRGIREGKLEDLTPLVVLVGPNASGKSSVLDGLLIGGSRTTGEAVGQAVARHSGMKFGAPWLLWRKGFLGSAKITIRTQYGEFTTEGPLDYYSRGIELKLFEPGDQQHHIRAEFSDNIPEKAFDADMVTVAFSRGNKYSVNAEPSCSMSLKKFPGTRIVEGRRTDADTPLYQLLDGARAQGLLDTVVQIVRGVVPGAKDLAIGVEGHIPLSYLDYGDHAVPVALCGDGVHSLVSLSLELAMYPRGTALLEEPEVHQHPGAIRQTMRAVLAAVRRDIQVVLTTQSLELVDALLGESSEEDIERLSLYRLELEDGKLISVRISGSEVAFSRCEIEKDLR